MKALFSPASGPRRSHAPAGLLAADGVAADRFDVEGFAAGAFGADPFAAGLTGRTA